MANLDDEPKTFDILRMGRRVELRRRTRRYLRLAPGLALLAIGVARGRLLGVGLAAIGLNLVSKQLTGHSLWHHARALRAARRAPALVPARRWSGNGAARDAVDEASWESFPASDPPGYYPGVN